MYLRWHNRSAEIYQIAINTGVILKFLHRCDIANRFLGDEDEMCQMVFSSILLTVYSSVIFRSNSAPLAVQHIMCCAIIVVIAEPFPVICLLWFSSGFWLSSCWKVISPPLGLGCIWHRLTACVRSWVWTRLFLKYCQNLHRFFFFFLTESWKKMFF